MARTLSASRTRPAMVLGRSTLSSALFQSSRVGRWNIMPTSARGLLTRSPNTAMSPEVRAISPATRRRRVDLPQPDGPISATNSP